MSVSGPVGQLAPDNHSRRCPPQPGRFPVGAAESSRRGTLGTPGGAASPRLARSEAAARSPRPRSFYRLSGRAGSRRPGSRCRRGGRAESPRPPRPPGPLSTGRPRRPARGRRPTVAPRTQREDTPDCSRWQRFAGHPRSSHSHLTPSGLQRPDLKSLDQRAQTAARALDRRCGRKQ